MKLHKPGTALPSEKSSLQTSEEPMTLSMSPNTSFCQIVVSYENEA